MTPHPELMANLKRRWAKTPTSPQRPTTPNDQPPGCPLDHRDPSGWKSTADPKRPGYRRVACGFCGRFYG